MADRVTSPWAVIVDDDGWTIQANSRAEAIDAAGAWWVTEWELGEADLDDREVTLCRGCTWVERPPEGVHDAEWEDLGHTMPEADAMMLNNEHRETVRLRFRRQGDPDCPSCGGSGAAATADGEALDCPRGCGEGADWEEVTCG